MVFGCVHDMVLVKMYIQYISRLYTEYIFLFCVSQSGSAGSSCLLTQEKKHAFFISSPPTNERLAAETTPSETTGWRRWPTPARTPSSPGARRSSEPRKFSENSQKIIPQRRRLCPRCRGGGGGDCSSRGWVNGRGWRPPWRG